MRSYQIMIDAVADLGKDLRDAYHIDQMCLCTTQGKMACLKGEACPLLLQGEDFFSLANLSLMLEHSFTRYAKADIDILYLAPAASLFPLFESAKQVAASVKAKYPSVDILVVDTESYGIGQGLLAVALAEKRGKGADLLEACEILEQLKSRLRLCSTIERPPRRGPFSRRRTPRLMVGRLFGFRPAFAPDRVGVIQVQFRAKGHIHLIEEALKQARAEAGVDTPLYLSYAGGQEFFDTLTSVLDENTYLCPMSALMHTWFGKEGCSLAYLVPPKKQRS